MTLPSSGRITINDVTTEVRTQNGGTLPAGYSSSLSWIRSNAKATVGGSTGVIHTLRSTYDKAYYQNTAAGNCPNGNCATGSGNCGDHNCTNCYNTELTNCTNCDTQKYLQPNCNCACTYNCNSNQVSLNCNCDCSLFCACACAVCACACSDVRLKQQVEPIQNPLDMVERLNGVYYTWNGAAGYYGKTPGQRTMGTIAQDTQQVIPEATGMYKDVLTIDPDGVNGLLVEAIKELRKEVKELKQGLK